MPQLHRNWALMDGEPPANASPLDALQRNPTEVVVVPDSRWRVQAWLSTQPRPDHSEPATPREGDGPQWPQPRPQSNRPPFMTMVETAAMIERLEEPAAAACLSALPSSLGPKVLHLLPLETRARSVAAMPLDSAVMCVVMLGPTDREATLAALPKAFATKVSAVLAYGNNLVAMPLPHAAETLVRRRRGPRRPRAAEHNQCPLYLTFINHSRPALVPCSNGLTGDRPCVLRHASQASLDALTRASVLSVLPAHAAASMLSLMPTQVRAEAFAAMSPEVRRETTTNKLRALL